MSDDSPLIKYASSVHDEPQAFDLRVVYYSDYAESQALLSEARTLIANLRHWPALYDAYAERFLAKTEAK